MMNEGDFIKITFEMRIGTDKRLVATNIESIAKENDMFDEEQDFNEMPVIVGTKDLFDEINKSILGKNVGEGDEVEIKSEKAYGERDVKNIKVHPYSEFQKNKIDPIPGNEVRIGNRRGRVLSVSPGRVVVDFNHPWAGKDVFYKYTIVSKTEDDVGKVQNMIQQHVGKLWSSFQVEESGDNINVTIPEDMKFNMEWFNEKFHVINTAREHLKGKTIVLIEKYELKAEETKPEASESNAEGSSNQDLPEAGNE
jgi:peptidylprolyl isomerase